MNGKGNQPRLSKAINKAECTCAIKTQEIVTTTMGPRERVWVVMVLERADGDGRGGGSHVPRAKVKLEGLRLLARSQIRGHLYGHVSGHQSSSARTRRLSDTSQHAK